MELVSIILPVYNGERYLAEAIQSCLTQSHQHIELIIVNDCSSDSSLSIAENFAKADMRIRVLSNEKNLNLPSSLNVGHKAASGNYMTWISDDNMFESHAIEALLKHLHTSDGELVFSNFTRIDAHSNSIDSYEFKNDASILLDNIVGASFLYSRQLYDDVGGYNKTLHTIEDYDFWLQASRLTHFNHVPLDLYKYRVHTESLSAGLKDDVVKKAQDFSAKLETSYCNFFHAFSAASVQDKAQLFRALHLGEFVNVCEVYKTFGNLDAIVDDIPFQQNKTRLKVRIKERLLLNVNNHSANQNLKTLLQILKYDSKAVLRHNHKRMFRILVKSIFS